MKRLGALLAALGFVLVVASSIGPPAAHATAATSPTTLNAEGDSWGEPTVKQLETDAAKGGQLGALTPTYLGQTATGEDGARTDFVNGSSDLAVSGAPLTADEVTTAQQNGITPAYVPYAVGPVDIVAAITANTPNGQQLITGLKLTMITLEQIMTHSGITRWDDPRISAEQDSPVATLLANVVNPTIQVVERADSSSTTTAVAAAFLANPTTKAAWEGLASSRGLTDPSVPPDRWPSDNNVNTIGEIGGSQQIAQDMLNINPHTGQPANIPDNSIGYIGPAWAAQYHIPVVAIQNIAETGGNPPQFVLPTDAAVDSAMASGATFDSTKNLYSITENFDYSKITAADAYPIPLVSNLIVPTAGASTGKAAPIAAFVQFALGTKGQADVAATSLRPVSSAAVSGGMAVASAVSAATTTSTSTTSTTSTTSSTSTTLAASTSSPSVPSSGVVATAAARTSGTNSSAATLPFSGGPVSLPIAGAGLGMIVVGDLLRRRARRART